MNLKNKKLNELYNKLLLICIFLGALNAFNGDIVWTFVIFFIIAIRMISCNGKMYFDNGFKILSLFSLSYILINTGMNSNGLQSMLRYGVVPPLAYFIGLNMVDKDFILYKFKSIILTISFGFFTHGALNMSKYNGTVIYQNIVERDVPDFWTNITINATLQNIFYTMIVSLLFYAIFIERNRLLKIVIMGCIMFSIVASIKTATRTSIYILGIVFIASIILTMYLKRNKQLKLINFIFLLSTVAIVAYFGYENNFLGIKSYYENSQLYIRMGSKQNNLRTDTQIYILKNLLTYPLGGNKLILPNNMAYAHNLWLDVVFKVGIIPFILLITYSVKTSLTVLEIVKSKKISEEIKYIIFAVFIASNLNFATEPILDGAFQFFSYFCMINGATKRLRNQI